VCEDFRKIPWVSWKSICLRQECGGLGSGRVLVARYEVERGRIRDGGRIGYIWWREIACIWEGRELGGSWFGEQVSKRVGDGSDTFFWTDPWVEEIHLCERFGRLFDLAQNKWQTVAEMSSLGWGWIGKRGSGGDSCGWQWQPDPDEGYTVQGAYQLLTSQVSATMDDADKLIWHSQVPLKVCILAWRLLRDRLPTKVNLVTRGILSPADHFCVSRCGEAESALHLFISCSTFGSLWTWVPAAAFLYAAYLAGLCLGCVDRKKSSLISRLSKQLPSIVGQYQNLFF
ncbi:hypothetical protein TSUD_118070, partial [Trifolium subterraneum]